eukprot:TRINITY_DN6352_c0_g1_i1.p2 TRINITY_DN6352_c0_g1~~TRINITY_DN6352_c0_g1_i1.p2  ORF type:complete len:419 (-),score=151.58 TRINITY_DN6352_c0_g1_i1:30-1286(-)
MATLDHPPVGTDVIEGEIRVAGEPDTTADFGGQVEAAHNHPPTGADVVSIEIKDSGATSLEEKKAEQKAALKEKTWFGKLRYKLREPLAEFLGTLILVLFGDGVIAQTILSGGANGNWLTIAFGWAMGIWAAIYVVGGISGAHLNPAVTLAFAVYRRFPWKKVVIFWIAQLLGAFAGAAIVYGNYKSAFDAYNAQYNGGLKTTPGDGIGNNPTAGVFSSFPAPFTTTEGRFFEELIATCLLVLVLFGSSDANNMSAGKNGPLVVAFTLLGITVSIGWQTGFALNPARDLGPRMLSAAAGWGSSVFTAYHGYTWIPVVATFSGALVAGAIYHVFIDSETNIWGVYQSKDAMKRALAYRPKIVKMLENRAAEHKKKTGANKKHQHRKLNFVWVDDSGERHFGRNKSNKSQNSSSSLPLPM